MDPQIPKYHRDAIALLPEIPEFSAKAAELLAQRERELGIVLPDSVREWYSLERAVDLLRQHSNSDHPVALDKLGEPSSLWYSGGDRNFVSQGLVPFMCENQGVCNWAFKLDGSSDPVVLVQVDSASNDKWQWLHCAEQFSTFVYCQIWDHRHALDGGIGVSAQELESAEADLQFLKANFVQGPSTYGWPGRTNYRFEGQDGGILIWDGEDRGTDWFVSAQTPASLRTLLSKIWHCGNLAETLYDLNVESAEVLRELREAGSKGK